MSDVELEILRSTINKWTKSINGAAATGNFLARMPDTPVCHLQSLADLARVCRSSSCDAEASRSVAFYCLSTAGSCCNFQFPPPHSAADDVADSADAARVASAAGAVRAAGPASSIAAFSPDTYWSFYERDMTEAEKGNLARDMRAAIDSLQQKYHDIWDDIRARYGAPRDRCDILRMGHEAVMDVANIVYDPRPDARS